MTFAPKYYRQVIYEKFKTNTGKILHELYKKSLEIIEAECYPNYIHIFVRIPLKYSMMEVIDYPKGKNSLMTFNKRTNLKYKYSNRHFWCRRYYVNMVGKKK
ncbi:MAG: hypothetical protein AMR96_05295 [Candidatus Adiutrix intracellularis]|jgi:REP element-mobilizing transposase RayT|nr:MAG: hypothetical protein AMR96_05295 [Candidatus Adiutrix intracellularis]MDR2826700.1 IS200/IS605 family transposase [Candidatus Adiutrix intracellularis]